MKRTARATKRERKEKPRESDGVLRAFILANPFALATGPDGAPLNCALAACSGAAALRRLGIDARPVACSVMALVGDSVTYTGHTMASAYDVMAEYRSRVGLPPVTRAEFDAGWKLEVESEYPHHIVIETRGLAGRTTFVDPTSTQVAAGTGLRLRLGASWSGSLGDGRFTAGDGVVLYSACRHADQIDRTYLNAINDALVDNYFGFIRLALDARGEPRAFREAVAVRDLQMVERADRFVAGVLAQYGTAE